MIDPRALRTFLTVCREGSISAAARNLNLSQPSVSVAVAQLERAVGASLLGRGRKGIALTAAGLALRRRAEMMEILLAEAEEAVVLAHEGARGPLKIGGTPGALVSLVPGALALLPEGERIALQIVERPDVQLTDMLRRGEIEVAVMTTGVEMPPPGIEERSIVRDPFSLIASSAQTSLGPTVSLAHVGGLAWVLPHAAGAFHRQIDALFLSAAMPVPIDVIRCDSLLTSMAIVQQTSRVTVLPERVVAADLRAGMLRAIPIEGARLDRSIGVRWNAEHPLSELGAEFIDAMDRAKHP